jgi:hypothetical protein
MLSAWFQELESLEAISQDEAARRICLRLAAMSQGGRLDGFLHELATDDDVDDATRGTLEELGRDPSFLFAFEDYLRRTHRAH